ncbi:C-type lectin domain-containing protein [Luteithermobacter gelatinilyticus]|uniref:C-type lectin domain-containing protein n=1 Tax=Luteithermobacter gelatinilyticus TaxID=2582913 RepID=UPI00143DC827|nr:C-type lectin domain-containing protein [Luteithermobacter gelatinilyticus]
MARSGKNNGHMFKNFMRTLCLVLIPCSLILPAYGQRLPVNEDYQYTGSMQGPVYNPDTKSYFELRYSWGEWQKAQIESQDLYYKGAQGRLAIIDRPEIHQFIISRFRLPGPTWIGLQYFCRSKQLKWVDNSDASKAKFSAWHTDWANTQVRCADKGYMPVAYVIEKGYPPRWQASGPHKGYQYYLVEYLTGKE